VHTVDSENMVASDEVTSRGAHTVVGPEHGCVGTGRVMGTRMERGLGNGLALAAETITVVSELSNRFLVLSSLKM
jgi:hypothetical protein